MKTLFLFLDGIGLGSDDPEINPFARTRMPWLENLLGGQKLLQKTAPFIGESVTLRAIDAGLGVSGLPQSATGQAVLLTGENIPAKLGFHYGTKPNTDIAQFLWDTTFSKTIKSGKKAALLNAYPPAYFKGIQSGKRLYSAIPLAAVNAGIPLYTEKDYFAGEAFSADFTGQGWRELLGYSDSPLYSPQVAGRILGEIACKFDFSFFEYWASDLAGHKKNMSEAVRQLEILDNVLTGLFETWPQEEGIVVITSDHGNMEDLSTRKHTQADVPLLIFGDKTTRQHFHSCARLTDIAPAIHSILGV